MLEHGGRLGQVAIQYGMPREQWLDLSTGINPRAWPVPVLPLSCWNRLPEEDDGLEQAACHAYGCTKLLPLAGSQAAIQGLPRLRPPCRVGVVTPAYAEHAHAWTGAGHEVMPLSPEAVADGLAHLDVLVVVNPNNPTGRLWPASTLLSWHQALARRQGWLVVDEAFMDADNRESVAACSHLAGLLVLRSLGKFYGLAGGRVGFCLADRQILQPLASLLGPWCVAGPSRLVARLALTDTSWQVQTRLVLQQDSQRLAALCRQTPWPPAGGTALFQWLPTPQARQVQQALARHGIWLRAFDEPAGLRCGLPGTEEGWQRLALALADLSRRGV